jgi:hypothetical protein
MAKDELSARLTKIIDHHDPLATAGGGFEANAERPADKPGTLPLLLQPSSGVGLVLSEGEHYMKISSSASSRSPTSRPSMYHNNNSCSPATLSVSPNDGRSSITSCNPAR